MKSRLFGCAKFKRLSSEQEDRELTPSEETFLSRHRVVCEECAKVERSTNDALNMLRMAAMEADDVPMFEDRVIRRLKVQQVKESLNYWSPALVGAAIACAVIFLTLHLATTPAQSSKANLKANEARRETPRLELDQPPLIR